MKDLKNKKKYTNEDYVRFINSNIDKDYEMFTKETFKLVPVKVCDKKIPGLAKKVPALQNVIRHKVCGHIFWMEREHLMSKIKKGLSLCPHCNAKHKNAKNK